MCEEDNVQNQWRHLSLGLPSSFSGFHVFTHPPISGFALLCGKDKRR